MFPDFLTSTDKRSKIPTTFFMCVRGERQKSASKKVCLGQLSSSTDFLITKLTQPEETGGGGGGGGCHDLVVVSSIPCWGDFSFRRIFSPLQKHVRKVVGGFGKKSWVGTRVRKPRNTCVSSTLAVKVALNPNTTKPIEGTYTWCIWNKKLHIFVGPSCEYIGKIPFE